MPTTNRPCTHHSPIWGSSDHMCPLTTNLPSPIAWLPALSMGHGGHQHWPPPHHTHWYDPCPLSTGPAPTTFRSEGVLTTCAHFSPTTTTPLVWPRPPTERALYEEAAHVTKRIRVLHPKTSPAGYCAPLGASIRMVCKFLLEGAKRQRREATLRRARAKRALTPRDLSRA